MNEQYNLANTKAMNKVLEHYGLQIREHIDITESTDDPGNTMLNIFFASPISGDFDNEQWESHKLIEHLITDLETQVYESLGDHHQEVHILSQNSELVITISEIK